MTDIINAIIEAGYSQEEAYRIKEVLEDDNNGREVQVCQ